MAGGVADREEDRLVLARAPCRTPPRPRDTSPPDCGRAGADRGSSRGSAGSCASAPWNHCRLRAKGLWWVCRSLAVAARSQGHYNGGSGGGNVARHDRPCAARRRRPVVADQHLRADGLQHQDHPKHRCRDRCTALAGSRIRADLYRPDGSINRLIGAVRRRSQQRPAEPSVRTAQCHAEVWGFAVPANADWQDSSSTVFGKEWIDQLQEKGFHARSGLRRLGSQPQVAPEIEGFVQQAVGAIQSNGRAGHVELETREANDAGRELEPATQAGHDAVGRGILLGFATPLLAQGRNFLLDVEACEPGGVDAELAVKPEALRDCSLRRAASRISCGRSRRRSSAAYLTSPRA